MYSENPVNDVRLLVKAFLSNQLARFAPSTYVKLTRQTGRGKDEGGTSEVADYFLNCVKEYFEKLDVAPAEYESYLQGKKILEYGPGDILGVALLLYAHGAAVVHCVDRFPLSRVSEKSLEVYWQILNSLDEKKRARAFGAFKEFGKPESGFNPNAIAYAVTPDGLSNKKRYYDLIISRAVLEHVNDLEKTIQDVSDALTTTGLSIHQVDLKSHGLDRYKPFDFLTWPDTLFQLMYSHKGFPNRWRVDKYKELVGKSGLRVRYLVPTGKLEINEITAIQPKLAQRFRGISGDELSWLGFWVLVELPALKTTDP